MHATTPGRRRDILDAALRCFAEKGVGATTIADVRRASNASVGSIYHHFGDKERLAASVYLDILLGYHHSLLDRLASFRSAEALVKGLVGHYLEWVDRNRDAALFLVEMRHAEAVVAFDRDIRSKTKRLLETTNAALERFAARGELRRLPGHLYTAIIIGPCQTTAAHWLRGGCEGDLRGTTEILAEAAWKSLAPGA